MTRERFEALLEHHNFLSVMEFLDLVEDWYNSLSPEDRYLLIKARCDEERAKTREVMEGGNNIE